MYIGLMDTVWQKHSNF